MKQSEQDKLKDIVVRGVVEATDLEPHEFSVELKFVNESTGETGPGIAIVALTMAGSFAVPLSTAAAGVTAGGKVVIRSCAKECCLGMKDMLDDWIAQWNGMDKAMGETDATNKGNDR